MGCSSAGRRDCRSGSWVRTEAERLGKGAEQWRVVSAGVGDCKERGEGGGKLAAQPKAQHSAGLTKATGGRSCSGVLFRRGVLPGRGSFACGDMRKGGGHLRKAHG